MRSRRRILIWAKTYPELSQKHTETVCTAGCFEDGSPMRLYPVPLRYLPEADQYKLYDWIEVDLRPSREDHRPESHSLAGTTVMRTGSLSSERGWLERRQVIERHPSWHYGCVQHLRDAQEKSKHSLGFVRVREVRRVYLKTRPAEEAEEFARKHADLKKKVESQTTLFASSPGNEDAVRAAVKRLVFQEKRVYVEWLCQALDCRGHNVGILDWGLGELGRRSGHEMALSKMEDLCDLRRYDLAFFMGNLKAHPQNFSIIGLWYPLRRDVERYPTQPPQRSLFDPP